MLPHCENHHDNQEKDRRRCPIQTFFGGGDRLCVSVLYTTRSGKEVIVPHDVVQESLIIPSFNRFQNEPRMPYFSFIFLENWCRKNLEEEEHALNEVR